MGDSSRRDRSGGLVRDSGGGEASRHLRQALAVGRVGAVLAMAVLAAASSPSPSAWAVIVAVVVLQVVLVRDSLSGSARLPAWAYYALGALTVGAEIAAAGGVSSEVALVAVTLPMLSAFAQPPRRVALNGAVYTATLTAVALLVHGDPAPGHSAATALVAIAVASIASTAIAGRLRLLVREASTGAADRRQALMRRLGAVGPVGRAVVGDLYDDALQLLLAARLELDDPDCPDEDRVRAGVHVRAATAAMSAARGRLLSAADERPDREPSTTGSARRVAARQGMVIRLSILTGIIVGELTTGEVPWAELIVGVGLLPWILFTSHRASTDPIGLSAMVDVAALASVGPLTGDEFAHTHVLLLTAPALLVAVVGRAALVPLLAAVIAAIVAVTTGSLLYESSDRLDVVAHLVGGAWNVGLALGAAAANRRLREDIAAKAAIVDARLESVLHDAAAALRRAEQEIRTDAALALARAEPAVVHGSRVQAVAALDVAIAATRRIASALHPPALAHGGIGAGLTELAASVLPAATVTVDVQPHELRLPHDVENLLVLWTRDLLAEARSRGGCTIEALNLDLDGSGDQVRLCGIVEGRRSDDWPRLRHLDATELLREHGATVSFEGLGGGVLSFVLQLPVRRADHPPRPPAAARG